MDYLRILRILVYKYIICALWVYHTPLFNYGTEYMNMILTLRKINRELIEINFSINVAVFIFFITNRYIFYGKLYGTCKEDGDFP